MKIAKQSVELIDFMGSDNSIVNAARVSFSKEANNYTEEQNVKLLKYLAAHGHWSPYAHAFLSFRIKAPIFVARQLVKHQVGLSWNEVSRRYVDDEPEFFFPEVWRGKPVNAKQGSSDKVIELITMGDPVTGEPWVTEIDNVNYLHSESCLHFYNTLIRNGVAPEQARMVLPLNTMTEWIWSGSLMAFARVCNQRLDPHAQEECQEIAKMIYNAVPKEFEHSWKNLVSIQHQ